MIIKKITLEDWEYTCGDGCCYNWGTDLYIDGIKSDQTFMGHEQAFEYVLEKLGIEVEYGGDGLEF